jgi:hypothetical protein
VGDLPPINMATGKLAKSDIEEGSILTTVSSPSLLTIEHAEENHNPGQQVERSPHKTRTTPYSTKSLASSNDVANSPVIGLRRQGVVAMNEGIDRGTAWAQTFRSLRGCGERPKPGIEVSDIECA